MTKKTPTQSSVLLGLCEDKPPISRNHPGLIDEVPVMRKAFLYIGVFVFTLNSAGIDFFNS